MQKIQFLNLFFKFINLFREGRWGEGQTVEGKRETIPSRLHTDAGLDLTNHEIVT